MSIMKRTLISIGASIIGLLVVAVATIYLWPTGNSRLAESSLNARSEYADSIKVINATIKSETQAQGIKPECRTRLYDHGKVTDKAVVMFQGYSACTSQFAALARQMYASGYNVYIPRAPEHGTTSDSSIYGRITAKQLTNYADSSITLMTGLGREVGVMGLSGGAALGTWAAMYRPDVVQRLVLLSPFYQPGPSQVPSWQLKPLKVLYGNHLLPDGFTGPNKTGFSYYGLTQYLSVVDNLKDTPRNTLKSLAVVTSAGDTAIDHTLAHDIPYRFVLGNASVKLNDVEIPKNWGVGHDIVATGEPDINGHEAQLLPAYQSLYEGGEASF